ncbi:MAG: sugar nucleotide-binding protein, partial [Chitinophagales bacterium]
KKGNYTEKDQPNPLNIYGLQKVEAEQEILRVYSNAAICRMPLMLGDAEGFHEKFLQQFLSKTTKKESMPLFTDEYRSPLGGNSAAKGLWLALEKMQGLYHLGGTERLSRWELGLIIAEKFGIDKQLLKAGKQADLKGKAPRPADVSLNSSKAVKLDFKPKRIAEDLD